MTIHDDLVARYGKPWGLPDRVRGRVLAFGHDTEEAAEAYAEANKEQGHPAWAENHVDHWVSVVDIRPALEKIAVSVAEAGEP